MSDLAAELRKVIEFDECALMSAAPRAIGKQLEYSQSGERNDPQEDIGWTYSSADLKSFRKGAKQESDRLRPVLLAMVECCEFLDRAGKTHSPPEDYGGTFEEGYVQALEDIQCWSAGTLARLREIVGMK